MIVSGIPGFNITFIGGYDDNPQEGYAKHHDINPETGQKETIRAQHLNTIELSIKELRDNVTNLVNSIKSSYGNSFVIWYKGYRLDNNSPDTQVLDFDNLDDYYMLPPLNISILSTYNGSEYTSVGVSSYIVTFNTESNVDSIKITLDRALSYGNDVVVILFIACPISNIDKYTETNGLLGDEFMIPGFNEESI